VKVAILHAPLLSQSRTGLFFPPRLSVALSSRCQTNKLSGGKSIQLQRVELVVDSVSNTDFEPRRRHQVGDKEGGRDGTRARANHWR
jgi:hypothetical protein